MTSFATRAQATQETLARLTGGVQGHLGADARRVLRDDTCIYVVGSGGRGEMSGHSDVDLFVARVGRAPSDVDAFQVRQAIARAMFDVGLPDPSQGGEFLKMHTAESLCERMGTPADDAGNTLTARMLLLLESRALLGQEAYERLLTTVLQAYWRNAKGHEADYQPFVIVNDIVRYWRILLLNYEAKNTEKQKELVEGIRVAERRLRSYKLRFSRCMTCFSMLAALLAATSRGGVTRDQVLTIVKLRPIERLQSIRSGITEEPIAKLLALYETFLSTTATTKKELVALFASGSFAAERSTEGGAFGDAMFELLERLAQGKRARELFRYMVV